MRCKTCEYPLWEIAARQCPECGTPFRPSEYDFTYSAVRFKCPHCTTAYYGTGPRGQLVPSTFPCATCGQVISTDDMVLAPAEGVSEERTQGDLNPWVERRQMGFFRAFIRTFGKGIAQPDTLIRLTPVQHPLREAFLFASLVHLLIQAVSLNFVVGMIIFGPLMADLVPGGVGMALGAGLGLIAWAAFVMVATVVWVLAWAGVTHGILRLSGSAQAGFRRTIQCVCYSSPGHLLLGIPCVGGYLAPLAWTWWAVLVIFMLREVHKVSGLRASLAALALPGSLLLMLAGFIVWMSI